MAINPGDIYYVYLDPVFGREIGGYKERPVVVISIPALHDKTRLVAVVPGTTARNNERQYKNVVKVKPDNKNNLKRPTNFKCNQIRTIDAGRFTRNSSGKVTREELEIIKKAIMYTLGIESDF